MHVNQIFYGYASFNKIAFILFTSFLKLTCELSDIDTSFSFHIIIKGHIKELKHNSVILSLNRL